MGSYWQPSLQFASHEVPELEKLCQPYAVSFEPTTHEPVEFSSVSSDRRKILGNHLRDYVDDNGLRSPEDFIDKHGCDTYFPAFVAAYPKFCNGILDVHIFFIEAEFLIADYPLDDHSRKPGLGDFPGYKDKLHFLGGKNSIWAWQKHFSLLLHLFEEKNLSESVTWDFFTTYVIDTFDKLLVEHHFEQINERWRDHRYAYFMSKILPLAAFEGIKQRLALIERTSKILKDVDAKRPKDKPRDEAGSHVLRQRKAIRQARSSSQDGQNISSTAPEHAQKEAQSWSSQFSKQLPNLTAHLTASVSHILQLKQSFESFAAHKSTTFTLSLVVIAVSAVFMVVAIYHRRSPDCNPVPSVDDNFFNNMSQMVLAFFSAYIIFMSSVRARNLRIRYNFWFRSSLLLAVLMSITSSIVYPFFWQASTILSYVSNLCQIIATLQFTECIEQINNFPEDDTIVSNDASNQSNFSS